MGTKRPEAIDIKELAKLLWKKKWIILIAQVVTFILSCVYILSIPRYYVTDIKLAPELGNNNSGNALSSIASTFGFDLSDVNTTDAITPVLYPNLIEDNAFVISLWNIPIADIADSLHTTYYDYLCHHQQQPWWTPAITSMKKLLPQDEDTPNTISSSNQDPSHPINPYLLTRKQNDIVEAIRSNIAIDFDKKTFIISISVTDQDPLICKTIADTVMQKIQYYITDYRTRKARVDQEYYQKLTDEAKADYEKIRIKYVKSEDANTDVILKSVRAKVEDMENEMQLKYDAYTNMQKQLQAATAKVQENTPAFTVIKGSAVPVKPTGPKRMVFVAAMEILITFIFVLYYLRGIIFHD